MTGLEPIICFAIYAGIEYLLGKTKRIEANSIPEATVERVARAAAKLVVKAVK